MSVLKKVKKKKKDAKNTGDRYGWKIILKRGILE
jgi:hypothetical protein